MELQQYLPFTVLKHGTNSIEFLRSLVKLQQYLPFTVLKQHVMTTFKADEFVATVLTVYGIETLN